MTTPLCRLLAFSVGLVAITMGAARAQTPPGELVKTPIEYIDAIAEAYEGDDLSQGFAISSAAHSAYPGNPRIAYLHAVGLGLRNRNKEAIAVCEETTPTEAGEESELLECVASNYGILGDWARSLEFANRALKADPSNEFALLAKVDAELVGRIRSGDKPPLPADSASAFVAAFIARVENGDLSGAITEWFDRQSLEAAMRESTELSVPSFEVAVRAISTGLAARWGADSESKATAFVGYEVNPEIREGKNGASLVDVTIVSTKTFTAESVAKARAFANVDEVRGYVNSDLIATVEALDEAEVDSFFDNLVGAQRGYVQRITFEVRPHEASGWTVQDVTLGAMGSVLGLVRNAGALAEASRTIDGPLPPNRKKKGTWDSLIGARDAIMKMLIPVALIVLFVAWVRKKRPTVPQPDPPPSAE